MSSVVLPGESKTKPVIHPDVLKAYKTSKKLVALYSTGMGGGNCGAFAIGGINPLYSDFAAVTASVLMRQIRENNPFCIMSILVEDHTTEKVKEAFEKYGWTIIHIGKSRYASVHSGPTGMLRPHYDAKDFFYVCFPLTGEIREALK